MATLPRLERNSSLREPARQADRVTGRARVDMDILMLSSSISPGHMITVRFDIEHPILMKSQDIISGVPTSNRPASWQTQSTARDWPAAPTARHRFHCLLGPVEVGRPMSPARIPWSHSPSPSDQSSIYFLVFIRSRMESIASRAASATARPS